MLRKRFLFSCIFLIISVIFLINVPLVRDFPFMEEGYMNVIDIYPNTSNYWSIFNGVEVGENPIQVRTNYAYFDSSLVSNAETIVLNNGTIFKVEPNRSYIIYGIDDEGLYLTRTLRYLNGIDMITLSFIILFIVSFMGIIVNIVDHFQQRLNSKLFFRVTKAQHLSNALFLFNVMILFFVAMVFLLKIVFVYYLIDRLFFTDTTLLFIYFIFIISVFIGSILIERFSNQSEIIIENNSMYVNVKYETVFQSPLVDISYNTAIVLITKDNRHKKKKEYKKLTIGLQSNNHYFELNMYPFGPFAYKKIVKILEENSTLNYNIGNEHIDII